MEVGLLFALIGVVWIALQLRPRNRRPSRPHTPRARRQKRERPVQKQPQTRPIRTQEPGIDATPEHTLLLGRARIIDGDSLVVENTEIRLFGVDAPEMAHPYGQKAKWALVALCKGQDVRVEVICRDDYNRAVGKCTLDDGRDLSAEMVKLGLAIDWPKFSKGCYRALEPDGIRKKLWLADARQKGRMDVWTAFEERARSSPKR
jgi:endonuclease YncB( thermonuclease family)